MTASAVVRTNPVMGGPCWDRLDHSELPALADLPDWDRLRHDLLGPYGRGPETCRGRWHTAFLDLDGQRRLRRWRRRHHGPEFTDRSQRCGRWRRRQILRRPHPLRRDGWRRRRELFHNGSLRRNRRQRRGRLLLHPHRLGWRRGWRRRRRVLRFDRALDLDGTRRRRRWWRQILRRRHAP